ncbi:MAG: hypothetical protein RBT41_00695 [Clostridia bacterium]|nr:hypothetical protein [Clostridia bacterium]
MPFYHIRRLLIILFILTYLLSYFTAIPALAVLNGFILAFVLLQGFLGMPKVTKTVSLGLLVIGAMILFAIKASWLDWLAAIANNAGLVTLFLVVPILGMPFFYNDYEQELKNVARQNIGNILTFSLLIFLVAHLLGGIISVGAVALVYEIFIGSAREIKAEKLMRIAMIHGYVTTGFWSPTWASMAAVVSTQGVSWFTIIPYGFGLVLACLLLSFVYQRIKLARHPEWVFKPSRQEEIHINWSHILSLVLLIVSLLLAILLFDLFTNWQLLIIVSIVALLFPVGCALVMNKGPELKSGLAHYYRQNILKSKNEVVLFTVAGFLGKALELSGAGEYIVRFIPESLSRHPFLLIVFICILMVLFSLGGIHPVVTGSALLGALQPALLNLSTLEFSLAILLGWTAAILLSPFSAMNLILSGLTGEASWNISKKNALYGIVMIVMVAALITLFI